MYLRSLNPSLLAFSLSLHRHPYICILIDSRFISYNKHTTLEKYGKDFSGDRVLGSVVSLIGRQLVSTETSVGIENLL